MIITRTTPVSKSYDSYTVEIKTMIGDGDGYNHLTMGPFKRVQHWENLKNLLELLSEMKKEGFVENYKSVVGFLQWFNSEVKTLDDLADYDSFFRYADDDEKEKHEEIFSLSKNFSSTWPYDPRTDEGYHQILDEFKVFYCDYSGTLYNAEVTL